MGFLLDGFDQDLKFDFVFKFLRPLVIMKLGHLLNI